MEPRIQYAKTADGVSIAFWTLGEGEPLVITPPQIWSHLQLEWQNPMIRSWYEQLAETRRLVRYDFRGQGLSERNVRDLTFDAFVLDLETVVDHLELEDFAVYAVGPNTPLVIAYVAQHPERVAHLVLWQPVAKLVSSNPLGDLAEKDWELFTESAAHAFLGWSAGQLAHEWARFIRQSIEQTTWIELTKDFDRIDATPHLPEVRTPTLVLTHTQARGQSDPRQVSAFASQMQNARVVFLDGPDSAIPFSDAALRAIKDFLDEGGETAPPKALPAAAVHTILFTDIADSTALTQRLGDAKAQELLRIHNTIVRDALKAHGGAEIKHTGDGIMTSFPSASHALDFAIAIQRAVAAHVEQHADSPLGVHIGLNAGEPVAEEQDLFGTAVQLARRVCDHAEAGQILASNVVRELTAGKGFMFSDIGEVLPKGFDDAVRLYEVRWRE